MCGIIFDLVAALSIDLPFSLAWKRVRHIRYGHVYDGSKPIDKLRSENHPHTGIDYVYTINLRECECGLIFQDCGLERRGGYNPLPSERVASAAVSSYVPMIL